MHPKKIGLFSLLDFDRFLNHVSFFIQSSSEAVAVEIQIQIHVLISEEREVWVKEIFIEY